MIIDTHVHYNLEPLFSNNKDWESEEIATPNHWRSHWQKSQQHEVGKSIVVGTNVSTSFRAIQIASNDPQLFCSVGLHPTEVPQFAKKILQGESENTVMDSLNAEINKIENLAVHHPIVAIGEIGLDYFHLTEDVEEQKLAIKLQTYVFSELVTFGKRKNLPIICHVRDKKDQAYFDALTILQKIRPEKCVLHCVSGPDEYLQQALKLGAYAGFDGNITYPNAEHIRHLFSLVPADKRLLETDAPFLPPQEYRGQTCEPWMISKTAEFMKEKMKFEVEKTTENAETLFGL